MINIECKISPTNISDANLIIRKSFDFEAPNEIILELSGGGVRFNANELLSAIKKCTFSNSLQIINITCKVMPTGLCKDTHKVISWELRRNNVLVVKSPLYLSNRVVLEIDGRDTEFHSRELIEAIERCSTKFS